MKEIKFRAWDGELMLPVESICFDTETVEVLIPCDSMSCEGHPIDYDFGNVVLMQYTGLKDKNGREIYEGDILKIDDDWEKWGFASGFVGYVIYDQGSFKLKEGEIYAPAYRLDSSAEEGATVIGNVYENLKN